MTRGRLPLLALSICALATDGWGAPCESSYLPPRESQPWKPSPKSPDVLKRRAKNKAARAARKRGRT